MAIKDRELVKAGAKMVATYLGTEYECKVSEKDDKLVFKVGDRKFTSITGAARWIVGGCPEDADAELPHRSGWTFWSLPSEIKEAKAAKETKKAAMKAKKAAFEKLEGEVTAEDGTVMGKFYCKACADAFPSPDETPEVCSFGHTAAESESVDEVPAEAVPA